MDEHPQENRKPASGPNKRKQPFLALLLFLLVCIIIGVIASFKATGMMRVLNRQLEHLRENRITQAYFDHSSRSFRQHISLEEFRQFLALYSVLSDNKAFLYEERDVRGDQAVVVGTLVSNRLEEMKVEYSLVQEEGEWKIQRIRLQELPQPEDMSVPLREMSQTVQELLAVFRSGEILDAYYSFFSKDFQQETPLAIFEEYVGQHPALVSFKEMEVSKASIEDGTGFVTVALDADSGKHLAEYRLKQEGEGWKVWSLRLFLPQEEAVKRAQIDTNALLPPVKEMLELLKSHDVLQAYRKTAREFQEETSLAVFDSFVRSFPAFSDRDLTDIKPGVIDKGVGKVKANLHNADGMTILEFQLGFDSEMWKVWGVKVLQSPKKNTVQQVESLENKDHLALAEEVTAVINESLKVLRHQDAAKAYDRYFSIDWRQRFSLSDFEAFLEGHPVFCSSRGCDFDTLRQNGPVLSLKGILTTLEYSQAPVFFDVVKEGGRWKVQNAGLLDNEIAMVGQELPGSQDVYLKELEEIETSNTKIQQVIVGVETDNHGVILKPQTMIDSDTNLLFFNVEIGDGVAGSLVAALLTHVDSGSSAPSIATTLKNNGHTLITFSLAAPVEGWPEGDYILKVTLDGSDEHLQKFHMRKGG